jgi:geranylgeranyl diphosphate synthase, type II
MLSEYKFKLDQKIDEFLQNLPPLEIYNPIKHIVGLGGKRFRSSVLLLITDLFNGDINAAFDEAIAVELFHNFTLIHDDIMDEAPLRRGEQTVHKKWDENIGILSGDILYAVSNQVIAKSINNSNLAINQLFQKTSIEVCEGQAMDMAFESREDVPMSEYLKMIELKTAVLVGCSMQMGALIATSSQENIKNIYDFGVNLGIAFQIHDDILDVFPDKDNFGKQVAGDILEGKKTVLSLKAIEKIDSNRKKDFIELLNSNNVNDKEKIRLVIGFFKELNVLEDAINLKNKYYKLALTNLSKLDLAENKKDKLKNFAEFLMNRNY